MNPQSIVYFGLILVGIGVSVCAIDPLEATALCYTVNNGVGSGWYECDRKIDLWFNELSQQSLESGSGKQ